MTMIILGTDYVLYLMLKGFNASLNIILRDLDSHTESDNNLPQTLSIKVNKNIQTLM